MWSGMPVRKPLSESEEWEVGEGQAVCWGDYFLKHLVAVLPIFCKLSFRNCIDLWSGIEMGYCQVKLPDLKINAIVRIF